MPWPAAHYPSGGDQSKNKASYIEYNYTTTKLVACNAGKIGGKDITLAMPMPAFIRRIFICA